MTTINSARRAFFRGGKDGIAHHVPWATTAFEDACSRCGDCVEACEEGILIAGDGGFPTVEFGHGGCSFCGACARACRTGALDRSLERPWRLRAVIGEHCLSAQGITCRSCGDACEIGAIRFRLQVGGRALPVLDDAVCNGCGSCSATCPTHVIRIQEAA